MSFVLVQVVYPGRELVTYDNSDKHSHSCITDNSPHMVDVV